MADNVKLKLIIDLSQFKQAIADAKGDLSSVPEETEVIVTADGDQAESEAADVEGAVEQIPDEHDTDIKADGANAMQTITAISVAYQTLSQIVDTVKNAISEYVNASNIQEDAEVKLAAALKNTGKYSDEAFESLKDFASGIQEITRYGDEAILSAMALAQNIGDFGVDVLPNVTKAAIGLSTAYDMDLKTSMMLVGRASKGQTQTLTRYGIVLDMTATKEEQFAELLEQGAKKFQLAKDQAESGAGALEQYSNLVGDAKEKIGDFIKIALVPLMGIFSKIAVKIGNFFRSLTETPLESTIRELRELGASVEVIQRLKKLQLKTEIIELNSELDKCNDKFKTTEEMVTEIEKIERELSFQTALYADAKAKVAENAMNERGAAADALNTYTGIATMSEKEVKTLQKKLKEYSTQLELMTSIEIKQRQVASLSEDVHGDIEDTNEELQGVVDKLSSIIDLSEEDLEIDIPDIDADINIDDSIDAQIEKSEKMLEVLRNMRFREFELNGEFEELEFVKLDERYNRELEALGNNEAAKTQLTEQYEREKVEISKKYDSMKLKSAKAYFRSISGLMSAFRGKSKVLFEVGKAASIAQAIINTYQAVTKALAAYPFPLNLIPAAAVSAMGFAQVANIKAQKYGLGGVIHGKKHSEGGEYPELEDKEIVLTSGVYKDPILRQRANDLNIEGGGIPITNDAPKLKYQYGGVIGKLWKRVENLSSQDKSDPENILKAIETVRTSVDAMKIVLIKKKFNVFVAVKGKETDETDIEKHDYLKNEMIDRGYDQTGESISL